MPPTWPKSLAGLGLCRYVGHVGPFIIQQRRLLAPPKVMPNRVQDLHNLHAPDDSALRLNPRRPPAGGRSRLTSTRPGRRLGRSPAWCRGEPRRPGPRRPPALAHRHVPGRQSSGRSTVVYPVCLRYARISNAIAATGWSRSRSSSSWSPVALTPMVASRYLPPGPPVTG